MDFLFALFGLVFLVVLFVSFVFLAIFLARKIGLLKVKEDHGEGEEGSDRQFSISSYLSDFKKLSESLVFRFITISVLIALMMLPLNMVNDIVSERSHLYRSVVNDVAKVWGHQQNLQGPALFIPYTEKYVNEVMKTDKEGFMRTVKNTVYKQRTAIILPDSLNIDIDLKGESRKRSIYKALVYSADLNIKGDFERPDIASLSDNIDEIHWQKAWLSLGISDTQAINKVSRLYWNNKKNIDFEPGTKRVGILRSGFHAPLDLTGFKASSLADDVNHKANIPFSMSMNVNGSRGFYFSPFGKTTNVDINSDWPHPSFQGNVLPDTREVSDAGFKAQWSVPHLARNYPQVWTLETQEFDVKEFSAGVNLFESVSLYSQITRAIKYGLLFFTLTFITFLIFELGIGRRLHIVQYGVIGLALSMFYLTLLSMAEHSGFLKAYISAASIIVVMISLYAYAAIRHLGRTAIIAALLLGLYSLLYSLLKLEDYALLAGTGLLLIILGILMYLTRNIGSDEDHKKLIGSQS